MLSAVGSGRSGRGGGPEDGGRVRVRVRGRYGDEGEEGGIAGAGVLAVAVDGPAKIAVAGLFILVNFSRLRSGGESYLCCWLARWQRVQLVLVLSFQNSSSCV